MSLVLSGTPEAALPFPVLVFFAVEVSPERKEFAPVGEDSFL